MLSFLSPLFLAGAAAAAVPIVLHLLKREPEPRVKFAAVKLLKRAPVEHTEKRRLRELLLLALRVAALVLLALAFARPFFASGAAIGATGVTMVALDTSYSLSAPGRFERAKAAREGRDRPRAGRRSRRRRDVRRRRGDRGAAVGRSRPRARPRSIGRPPASARRATAPDCRAAAQMLGGRRGTIVVVTDLQESGWDAGDRVVRAGVDADRGRRRRAAADDLAVTGFADRRRSRRRDGPQRGRARRGRHAAPDGRRPAGRRDDGVARRAMQSADVPMPTRRPAGATASVAGRRPARPPGGQRAVYAVLGDSSRSSVLVVTSTGDLGRDAFYLAGRAAARASAGRRTYDVAGVSARAALDRGAAARLRPTAAVVCCCRRAASSGAGASSSRRT